MDTYTWPWMAAGNEVTLPDIMAANGVIHGIDGVITDVTGGHSVPKDMVPKEDMDMDMVMDIGNIPAVLPRHTFSKFAAADVLAMDLPAEVATLDGAIIKIEKTTDGKLLVVGLRPCRVRNMPSTPSTSFTWFTSFQTLGSSRLERHMTRRAVYTWPWMAAGNEVTLPDIMAANGVIHGIDGVITDVTGGHSE